MSITPTIELRFPGADIAADDVFRGESVVATSKQGDRLLKMFIELVSPGQSIESLGIACLCTKTFMSRFALWLVNDARSLTGGQKHYSCGAAWGYFGAVKGILMRSFPDAELWRDSGNWYESIRDGMERRVQARCFEEGTLVRPIGDIIGQDLLVLIIRAYLRRPDQIEACEKIFKLIMLYYGIGRAGEIAFSSWNHARLVSNIFTSVCWFDDT
jgi:hypothetical protein